MKWAIPIAIAAQIACICGLKWGTTHSLMETALARQLGLVGWDNRWIEYLVNCQIGMLLMAAVSLAITYLLNPRNCRTFLSIGRLDAPANELKIMGIRQGSSWVRTGLWLSTVITAPTAIFMVIKLRGASLPTDWSWLNADALIILLCAMTNAFGEEVISRLGIIAPLTGSLSPRIICWISATIFGASHWDGIPNGWIGMVLAGAMGFVLAKAMCETRGMFWSWFIHVLQDVVIWGSIYLAISSGSASVSV